MHVQSNLPYPDLQYTGTSLYRAVVYGRACAKLLAAQYTMASKRKRSVMSLEKKLDIIADLRQGKSQRAVSDRFGVAESTVGDIWKNKDKIETYVTASATPTFAKRRCIVRNAHFQKLDEACYLWFQQQRAKGAPAYKAFGIALQWLECQGTDPAHLMLVKNWMTTAGRKRDNSLTQTEITSYFKPHTS